MTKVALLTDTHYTAKECEFITSLLNVHVLPVMEDQQIEHLFELGDFTDNRHSLEVILIDHLVNVLAPAIKKADIKFSLLLGNHQMAYKDKREVNALSLMKALGFNIFEQHKTITVYDKKIAMVPFLLPNEKLDIKTKPDYIFAHFELSGARMTQNYVIETGMNRDEIDEDTPTYTGHYHIKQALRNDSIHYLGTMYQKDWGDFGLRKGFHTLDLETNELEFIEIESVLHLKVNVKMDPFTPETPIIEFVDGIDNDQVLPLTCTTKEIYSLLEAKRVAVSLLKIKLTVFSNVKVNAKIKSLIIYLESLELKQLKVELIGDDDSSEVEIDEEVIKSDKSVTDLLLEAYTGNKTILSDVINEAKIQIGEE